MDVALRNAVSFLGVTVEQAVVMASTNPARLLGLAARKGAIAAGMDADLVLLDDELRVRGTMVGGAWGLEPAAGGRDREQREQPEPRGQVGSAR